MSLGTREILHEIESLDRDIKDGRLRLVMLTIEEEIEKMRDEHAKGKPSARSARILQDHTFDTALIFLRDRIAARLERDAKG